MQTAYEIMNGKIVVIESQASANLFFEEMLRNAGYDNVAVVAADSIDSETLSQLQPDLVLMSLLGEEDCAIALLQKVSSFNQLLPILVLADVHDRACRLKALENGASDYLELETDLIEFSARTRNLLCLQMARRELVDCSNLDSSLITQKLAKESESRRQAEARLLYLALHDERTGLPNRIMLQNRIAEKIIGDIEGQYAVMILSLTFFHEINHTLGYQNGNRLLAQIVNRLTTVAASCGGIVTIESQADSQMFCFAVLEGVNFALILDLENGQIDVHKVASRIMLSMQEPYSFKGMSIDVGMRIGIALYPEHGKTAIQLLQASQAALEQAFHNSQQLALYEPSVDQFSTRKLMLMGELRKAIQTNALELYYQPQIDLLMRTVRGVEALLRWNHPQLGFIPPDEFIPLAENTGVIRPLTRWVLNQAITQCAEFIKQDKPLRMSINVSARNIQEDDIFEYIDTLLVRHQIPVEMVALEITESAMMTDPQKTMCILNRLKERGISFSIDDFGTGHSSLAYIKKLPIGEIKIDRSFVMDMLQDREDLMIVHATIELGHNLGLEVVAEGVETQQEWDQLRDLGCDIGQGYFFGRPMAKDKFYEWMSAGGWSCSLSSEQ